MSSQRLLRAPHSTAPGRATAPVCPHRRPARPCIRVHGAPSNNNVDGAPLQPHKAGQDGGPAKPVASPKPAETLNLAFESDKKLIMPASKALLEGPVKTTGLHRAPLSGGVKTATSRCAPARGAQPRDGEGQCLHGSQRQLEGLVAPPGYELPSPPVAVRNLVEHARFGHLCTMMSGMHHRRAGYPFGTLVDFASDGAGYPVFCLSPLAIHSRNLIEEPRCSLVVQMPGWTGLANARVTIFGDVYQLPADLQDSAREIFIAKHSNERKERWVSGNFVYFRMNSIVDIYFVGGFGTVQWIAPEEYLAATPDEIVLNNPAHILHVLNDQFVPVLRSKLRCGGRPLDDLVFISIDASGVDIRVRTGQEFSVERIGFTEKVTTLAEAIAAMQKVVADVSKATPCTDE